MHKSKYMCVYIYIYAYVCILWIYIYMCIYVYDAYVSVLFRLIVPLSIPWANAGTGARPGPGICAPGLGPCGAGAIGFEVGLAMFSKEKPWRNWGSLMFSDAKPCYNLRLEIITFVNGYQLQQIPFSPYILGMILIQWLRFAHTFPFFVVNSYTYQDHST